MRLKTGWVKRTATCKKCGEIIDRGERKIEIWFPYGEKFYPNTFCYPCFLEKLEEWYSANPYEPETRRRKGKADPHFRPTRRRYLSLLNYHKKAGNMDKVEELEEEIRRLEI